MLFRDPLMTSIPRQLLALRTHVAEAISDTYQRLKECADNRALIVSDVLPQWKAIWRAQLRIASCPVSVALALDLILEENDGLLKSARSHYEWAHQTVMCLMSKLNEMKSNADYPNRLLVIAEYKVELKTELDHLSEVLVELTLAERYQKVALDTLACLIGEAENMPAMNDIRSCLKC